MGKHDDTGEIAGLETSSRRLRAVRRLKRIRRERHIRHGAAGGLVAVLAAVGIVAATSGPSSAAEIEPAEPFELVSADVDAVIESIDAQRVAEQTTEEKRAEADAKAEAEAEALEEAAREAEKKKEAEEEAEAEAAAQPDWISPSNASITSNYGQRWGRLHAGLDFGNNTGDPIWAIADGTVTYAGWMDGYGNMVVVDHGDGVETAYAHATEVLVSVGDEVAQGDEVSLTGSTGNSTGPHLHFEVRIDGEQVDPLPWLEERGVNL